jgi:hypothetical protein
VSFARFDDVQNSSADLLGHFGVNRYMGTVQFIANDEAGGYIGAAKGGSPNATAFDLLMAHQSFAG